MNAVQERWNLLSKFVEEICEGRDPSHGHKHMKAVAEKAHTITMQDYIQHSNYASLLLDAITVAWLHDVSDHKYDHDGTLDSTLDDFGNKNIHNYLDIKKAVKLISYSSENKAILAGKPLDYENLLGEHYATVRHIVSDADKLEAIGSVGVRRCIEYSRHAKPELSEEELVEEVKKHADEKLLRLKDEFIRTNTGKLLSEPLHKEMIEILATM
jgi:HD superfamily phosphodiesterase